MVFKNFLSKAKDIDILSSLPDGVMLLDGSGKIEWSNDVAPILLKMSKNDVLKFGINDIIESGLELARQAAESAKSAVGRLRTSSGKETYLEITSKAVDDYFVFAFRDVTQNYKTVTNMIVEHESSKKVNKDKNVFLNKLSNELKSPIHSIIGFSQAMVDGLGGEMSEKQAKYIKIINKNSNEVLYLIDKILELSKTESDLLEADFQIFDVVNATQNVLKNFEQSIKDKNMSLNFVTDELVKKTIYSSESMLKMVLNNIMETSLNSTDIGSVTVRLSHPDLDFVSQSGIEPAEECGENAYLMISVSDTGAGIIENDLNVIFEPYAQLDRPNKKNIVRSIALASVKNIVKDLGGSVWIESEPMQGSIYNVIIPIEKN